MILYDHERRWAEVRLYKFCIDIFALREKTIDIFNTIELICTMYDVRFTVIKRIVLVMLDEDYFKFARHDIIMLGKQRGMSGAAIARYLGLTRQTVNEYIREHTEAYEPHPHFQIDEDSMIVKFLEALEKFQSIGVVKDNGSTYKIPIRGM